MRELLVSRPMAPPPPLATPGERCRMGIPGQQTSFEGGLEFVHGAVVHSVVHAPIQNPEERLGQVQPRAFGRRIAQREAIAAFRCCRPGIDLSGVVDVQVVQNCEQLAARRQAGQLVVQRWQQKGKDRIFAAVRSQHRDDMTITRVQQRQELARAQSATIGRTLAPRTTARLPTAPPMRDWLQRAVLVETHHPMWAGGVLQRRIGVLDRRAFSASCGSVLAQNERSACQLSPASTKKRRTVVGSMCSKPGSHRTRRVSNSSDQVAVPSRSGSGGVRPISKTRWRSAGPYHTGAPDLGRSTKPSNPWAWKRRHQSAAVFSQQPALRPAAASDMPLTTASTIAARWWSRRVIPRAATRRRNSCSSSFVGVRVKQACGRAIRTSRRSLPDGSPSCPGTH